MKVLDSGIIKSKSDIYALDIIDFNRLNGCFENTDDAMNTIFSWFNHSAFFTVVEINDYYDAPVFDNFPGWKHAGNHEDNGRYLWNWMNWKHPGIDLRFGDEPDFSGAFPFGGLFWGDIGKISASAFAMTQKGLDENSLWITSKGKKQITIQPLYNINDTLGELLGT